MPKLNTERLTPGMRVHDKKTGSYGVVEAFAVRKKKNHGAEYGSVTVRLDNGLRVEDDQYRFFSKENDVVRLSEIDPFPVTTPYTINVGLGQIEMNLELIGGTIGVDLDPDFQRGHVWTQAQQERFVEYRLRGGLYGRDLWFNGVNFGERNEGPVQIVDGLQRLTAVRRFINDEIPAFGQKWSAYTNEDRMSIRMDSRAGMIFHVTRLATRKDVLKFYIDLNAAGTPHSPEEIARVRALLEKEG